MVAQVIEPPPPPQPKPTVKIKGLKGTLNTDDVNQAMDTRQAALDACIVESRRRLRWVSGEIKFALKVAVDGSVAEVHAVNSNVGHRALETCLIKAVAETHFPEPDGDAVANVEWGLRVEPASSRMPEENEEKAVAKLGKLLEKKEREILDHCAVKRPKERFQVTAYLTRAGKFVSCGATARPPQAEEKVDCVLEELAALKLPKLKREAKLTFELR